jgi:ssDNA-binding Zn-finger/Zn-ribbon topoisomerase 1
MVLRRGPFGMFMSCPGYNEDPPCKTFRKLSQKQQQKQAAPQPTGEDCPLCGKPLVLRQGSYGEFVSCSGYPKCKYVKQNLIEGMKCPKCGTGDLAERKARRGNIFWGCTNYPKCDFTSNNKPVAKKCPECGSPYLVEKTLKSGIFLECPNKKKAPRKRLRRRSGQEGRCGRRRAPWCAATRSGLAMRRRRRRPRRMGRWWRKSAGKKPVAKKAAKKVAEACCSQRSEQLPSRAEAVAQQSPAESCSMRQRRNSLMERMLATPADAEIILRLYELRTER